jgi:hypothetical protein
MADCCAVKESQAKAPTALACPVSGARSKPVNVLTVKSLVRHLSFGAPRAQYYFCEDPNCDVVYFPWQPEAPVFRKADLCVRVGLKEKSDPVPVCYCFGVTRKDIEEELRQTGQSSFAQRIKAEVQAGHCACEVKNPSGKCCLGNVTRAVKEAQAAVQLHPQGR